MTRNRPTRDPDVAALHVESEKVRQAIEATPPTERAGNLVNHPRECCDHGMRLLALHLSGLGFTTLMRAKGERPNAMKFHVLLECRGVILDITADQFGKSYHPVIVARRSRWHEAWKPKREPITEELITSWREADTEVHHTYRKILARLMWIGPKHSD